MNIKQIKPFRRFNPHPPGVKKSFGITKPPKPTNIIAPQKSRGNKFVKKGPK